MIEIGLLFFEKPQKLLFEAGSIASLLEALNKKSLVIRPGLFC
jgi:hypothetical protein